MISIKTFTGKQQQIIFIERSNESLCEGERPAAIAQHRFYFFFCAY